MRNAIYEAYQKIIENYLMNLNSDTDKDHSLRKSQQCLKRPFIQISTRKESNGHYKHEKVELFAQHLVTVF